MDSEALHAGDAPFLPLYINDQKQYFRVTTPPLVFQYLFSFINEMSGNLICFAVNPLFLIKILLRFRFTLYPWDSEISSE